MLATNVAMRTKEALAVGADDYSIAQPTQTILAYNDEWKSGL
jgi:hypothetical protein